MLRSCVTRFSIVYSIVPSTRVRAHCAQLATRVRQRGREVVDIARACDSRGRARKTNEPRTRARACAARMHSHVHKMRSHDERKPCATCDDAIGAPEDASRGSGVFARRSDLLKREEPDPCGSGSGCSPEQIRTAVTALRGRRPRPLDDGAVTCLLRARGGGLEPPKAGPEPAVLPITPPPKGPVRVADRSPAQPKRTVNPDGRERRGAGRGCVRGRADASSRTGEDPGGLPRPRRRPPARPSGI